MALNSPEEDGGEKEVESPTVGSRWLYTRRNKDGTKLLDLKGKEFPAQEVEVVTVNNEDDTVTLKTKDGKPVNDPRTRKAANVKWEWLDPLPPY
jgi:hypothetical protein